MTIAKTAAPRMPRACLPVALALFLSLPAAGPAAAADGALPPPPKRGEIPPDALGRDRNGDELAVSQFKGKVLIVTFWASWCGPCRRELPILGKVQQAVGREHLDVVAINYKEDRDAFNRVIRANPAVKLTYVQDTRGRISDTYGVKTVPHMFIVGPDGRVAHVHNGYSPDMLDGFVKEMLALLPPEVLARPPGS
ncbi:TlpA family protein disulfide reductase [Luteimonas aquatica]|uniref:TlpA family protein disulfide reductase n=1 Tax=Luteimonas aquatica TaxID=450364 RepID=UPI001F5AF61D|nr:TlpA disulfide reductase family protein [Luteimonas aquatica]